MLSYIANAIPSNACKNFGGLGVQCFEEEYLSEETGHEPLATELFSMRLSLLL